ncbi:MAG: dihydrofolate reductase family protein [Terracidiphilus sp.]
MRRLRYNVAASLDGFIAGPKGEYDWITPNSGIDFAALYRQFDTLLMGRRTFDAMRAKGMSPKGMGMKAFVISTTLNPEQHPGVTIIGSNVPGMVAALKAQPGSTPKKDIWLCGGGALFRCLLDAGLVDTVEVAVFPTLLGSGVPLLPPGRRCALHLDDSKTLPGGVLLLKYSATGIPLPTKKQNSRRVAT